MANPLISLSQSLPSGKHISRGTWGVVALLLGSFPDAWQEAVIDGAAGISVPRISVPAFLQKRSKMTQVEPHLLEARVGQTLQTNLLQVIGET